MKTVTSLHILDIGQIIVQNNADLSFVSIKDIKDPVAKSAFTNLASTGSIEVKRETQSEFEYQDDRYVSMLKPILGASLPWTIAIYAPENDFTPGY